MAAQTFPPEISGQTDTSMILDTFMYLNTCPENFDTDAPTFEEVMNAIDRSTLAADEQGHYDRIMTYLHSNPNSEVAGLHLYSYSDHMGGDYTGAIGCAFYSGDSPEHAQDVYVAYRGTGDGRWYDNGHGLASISTPYEEAGCRYLDSVMEGLHVNSDTNVYLTGHSKGGNQGQYAMLASRYGYLVDTLISLDGQGFSPEAADYFRDLLGEEEFNNRCERMYTIRGNNDYVNVLGNPIVPEDHRYLINTGTNGFLGSHEIENLYDYEHGHYNDLTDHRKELSVLAERLSMTVMKLPQDERRAVCHALMALAERAMGGQQTGLMGEDASAAELLQLLGPDMHYLTTELLSPEGQIVIVGTIHDWLKGLAESGIGEDTILQRAATELIAVIGTTVVSAVAMPLADVILNIVNLVSIVTDVAVHAGAALARFGAFCADLYGKLRDGFRYVFNAGYRTAQQYCASHNIIRLHTQDLRALADRLNAVNSRLSALDDRLSGLYRLAKLKDLKALIYAASADMKICYSTRLQRCAAYLNDTASRFEQAESSLLSQFG